MRIFATSDLHYGFNKAGDLSTRKLAYYVTQQGSSYDTLMLLGDICTTDQSFQECLRLFSGFPGKKFAVLGNHDLWVFPGEQRNSVQRLLDLTAIMSKEGFLCLEENPFIGKDAAFVGTIGWYDYSFREDDSIPRENYAAKIFPGEGESRWNDSLYVKWDISDERAVDLQIQALRYQLQELRRRNVKRIFIGMHHVPTKSLLFHPRALVPAEWRFMNSFLGSSRFESLFSEFNNQIELVMCGHIHDRKNAIKNGIKYVSVGSSYYVKELFIYGQNKITIKSF